MGTAAGANASHGLGYDVFGFFLRNGLAEGVYFSKQLPQFVRDLQFPPMWHGGRLEGTDADRLAFLNAAPQKSFDNGLLVRRETPGVTSPNVAFTKA